VNASFLHLAKLWHEMATEGERRVDLPVASEGGGEVIFLQQFQKPTVASSKQTGTT